jgi:hypothetical protein
MLTQITVPVKPVPPSLEIRGPRQLTVSWPPVHVDDPLVAPITCYEVVGRRHGASQVICRAKSAGVENRATLTRLAPGQLYEFAVCALNGAGPGPFGDFSQPISTSDKPRVSPTNLEALVSHERTTGTAAVKLSWEYQDTDDATLPEKYIVELKEISTNPSAGALIALNCFQWVLCVLLLPMLCRIRKSDGNTEQALHV